MAIRSLIFCLFASFAIHSVSGATGAKLSIGAKGQVKALDVSDLQKIVPPETMTVENPAYNKKRITYRGFPLRELLQRLSGLPSMNDYKIVVTCLDGYRPVLDATIFSSGRALLAYQEDVVNDPSQKTPDGLWTQVKLGKDMVSPGPFYIVWDSATGTYPQGWPFQIVEILLVPQNEFEDLKQLAPKGPFDALATQGFHTFTETCMVCHSIRYVGPLGKAPDLAYVTDYRDSAYLSALIQSGRGAMPAFASVLSKAQIAGVIQYLKNSAAQK